MDRRLGFADPLLLCGLALALFDDDGRAISNPSSVMNEFRLGLGCFAFSSWLGSTRPFADADADAVVACLSASRTHMLELTTKHRPSIPMVRTYYDEVRSAHRHEHLC
jgi:hypothetical protein